MLRDPATPSLRIAPVAALIVLPLLAGCLSGGPLDPGGTGEGTPTDPAPIDVPSSYATWIVRTSYNVSERYRAGGDASADRHRATDLPNGTRAANLSLEVVLEPPPGYENRTWRYHEGCDHYRCDDTPSRPEFVLPPPHMVDGAPLAYPLDGDGKVVFRFPASIDVNVGVLGTYPDPLQDRMRDPDGCERPQARTYRSHADPVEGSLTRGRYGASWIVDGDASMTLHWYGRCKNPRYTH